MGVLAAVLPQRKVWRAFALSTFVSVGNATQPFNRLLLKIADIADQLPAPVFVQHGSTPFSCATGGARPFVSMSEFTVRIDQAHLVIMHAGAGSVIHAVRAGKVPVVMPRRARYGEHIDDHQLEFARMLAESGKIVVAEEPDDLLGAAEEAMKRQGMARPLTIAPRMIGLISEVLLEYDKGLRK